MTLNMTILMPDKNDVDEKFICWVKQSRLTYRQYDTFLDNRAVVVMKPLYNVMNGR